MANCPAAMGEPYCRAVGVDGLLLLYLSYYASSPMIQKKKSFSVDSPPAVRGVLLSFSACTAGACCVFSHSHAVQPRQLATSCESLRSPHTHTDGRVLAAERPCSRAPVTLVIGHQRTGVRQRRAVSTERETHAARAKAMVESRNCCR